MGWLWTALVFIIGFGQTLQPSTPLNAPVSALAVSGDRLLIGQNNQVIDAQITANDLTISHTISIQGGVIRAITALDNGAALVLSEGALTALDSTDAITDVALAGGYRMAVRGERVYVAALADGVRVYSIHNGKLTLIGHALTDHPVEDVAPEGANWLWTAEGDGGVRLYDLTTPVKPAVIYESSTLNPVHVVRASGLRLIIGYDDQVAAFDTLNVKAPRLIGSVALGGSAGTFASDVLFDQSDVYVGRVDVGGSDVIHYTLNSTGFNPVANDGADGAGDVIALHGSDLFVGSERTGLHRLHVDSNGVTPTMAWNAVDFPACTLADYTPVNPSPTNLSLIPPSDQVTLTWSAACLAGHYTVTINGQPVGEVDQPSFSYTLAGNRSQFQWQIAAQTDAGTITSPQWTFESAHPGYLAMPSAPNMTQVLYIPPRIVFDFSALQTPGGTLLVLCGGLVIGLLTIVAGAWAIGVWSARRRQRI